MDQIYRAWINQPSTNQPLHSHHGRKCLVHDTGKNSVTVYFVDGPVHSMLVPVTAISRIHISSAKGK